MARPLADRAKRTRSPSKDAGSPASTAEPNPRRQRLVRDIALIAIAPFLLYLLACLFTYSHTDPGWTNAGSVTAPLNNVGGPVGAWIADVLLHLCGYVAYLLPLILGAIAWIALFGIEREPGRQADFGPALRLVGIVGFLVSATGLLYLRLPAVEQLSAGGGGILGRLIGNSLYGGIGPVGGNLFLLALFLVSVTLATGLSWFALMDRIGGWVMTLPVLLRRSSKQATDWKEARVHREERTEARKVDTELRAKRAPVRIEVPPTPPVVEKSERAKREQQIPMFHGVNANGSDLPPLSLLDDPKPQPKGYDEETLETLSRQIEFKLKDFRIDVEVKEAQPGPVITRFEMEPAPGVKVSQISSLDKDIARGLSVKAVRVVDVIPGKSVIGLEIPNVRREMIYLSELLRSKEYDKSASPLTLALGKGISGQSVVADLARMPHLLVAGTTGSGKSVAVNLGSNFEELLRALPYASEIDIRTYESNIEQDTALGRVDAFVMDRVSSAQVIKQSPLPLALAGQPFSEIRNALPFRNDEAGQAMRDRVDAAITTLKENGTLAEISQKWLEADVTKPVAAAE